MSPGPGGLSIWQARSESEFASRGFYDARRDLGAGGVLHCPVPDALRLFGCQAYQGPDLGLPLGSLGGTAQLGSYLGRRDQAVGVTP